MFYKVSKMPSKRVMWLGRPSFDREVLAIHIWEGLKKNPVKSLTTLCSTEIINFF